MVQQVVLDNGDIHEFPDEATPDQIRKAMNISMVSEKPKSASMTDRIASSARMASQLTPAGISGRIADIAARSGKDILAGAAEGGQNLSNLMTGGRSTHLNFPEGFGINDANIADKIAQGAGKYAAYGAAGGEGLLGQIAAGLAYGGTQTAPEENNLEGLLPKGRVGGAIESGAINALTHGAGSVIDALRPSKLFRGNLSPEELKENLRITQGTPTGLGDVIGSPFLKRQYENVISKLPFSSAVDQMQKAGQSVVERGHSILDALRGGRDPENVQEDLSKALLNKHAEHKQLKNELYADAERKADEAGLQLELPNFAKKANEYSDAIENTNMLKFDPKISQLFNRLKNYKNPAKNQGEFLDPSGLMKADMKYPSLKEANILSGKLREYAKTAAASPDSSQRYSANIFNELASSLKDDIKSTIEDSNHEGLKESFKTAEKNYADNYSPFLDKDIYKFIGGKADPDTLAQNFIKNSKSSDRVKHLEKLTKTLGSDKDLLSYSYFSRALDNHGNLNPGKLSTLVKNLGKKQFETLVDNAPLRQALKDYSKLYGMNTKGIYSMVNPETGQKNLDVLPMALAHAGQGALGKIANLLVPGFVSRPLVSKMTSPAYRESLVNSMTNKKSLPVKSNQVNYLAQALANMSGGNNQ